MTALLDADDARGSALPATFTEKVYVVPLLSPVSVIGLAGPVAVMPPGLDITVYPVMGLPPLLAGA